MELSRTVLSEIFLGGIALCGIALAEILLGDIVLGGIFFLDLSWMENPPPPHLFQTPRLFILRKCADPPFIPDPSYITDIRLLSNDMQSL